MFLQATIKHTSSGDTLSTNTSDEKWYDTGDDANGYHSTGVSVSKDVADSTYHANTIPTSASKQDTKEENRGNYAAAERYSPTDQLLQSRSREGIDMEQPRLQRPNHLSGIVPPPPRNPEQHQRPVHPLQPLHALGRVGPQGVREPEGQAVPRPQPHAQGPEPRDGEEACPQPGQESGDGGLRPCTQEGRTIGLV